MSPQQQTLFPAPETLRDICRRKHGGNRESEAANARVNKSEWRQRVLGFVRGQGFEGATADEVAAHFRVSHNTVAPRLSELKEAGALVPCGEARRLTRAGCWARVFICADGGAHAGSR